MRLCLYICAFHIHVRVCDWGCVWCVCALLSLLIHILTEE